MIIPSYPGENKYLLSKFLLSDRLVVILNFCRIILFLKPLFPFFHLLCTLNLLSSQRKSLVCNLLSYSLFQVCFTRITGLRFEPHCLFALAVFSTMHQQSLQRTWCQNCWQSWGILKLKLSAYFCFIASSSLHLQLTFFMIFFILHLAKPEIFLYLYSCNYTSKYICVYSLPAQLLLSHTPAALPNHPNTLFIITASICTLQSAYIPPNQFLVPANSLLHPSLILRSPCALSSLPPTFLQCVNTFSKTLEKLPCTLWKIRTALEKEGKRKVHLDVTQILVSK